MGHRGGQSPVAAGHAVARRRRPASTRCRAMARRSKPSATAQAAAAPPAAELRRRRADGGAAGQQRAVPAIRSAGNDADSRATRLVKLRRRNRLLPASSLVRPALPPAANPQQTASASRAQPARATRPCPSWCRLPRSRTRRTRMCWWARCASTAMRSAPGANRRTISSMCALVHSTIADEANRWRLKLLNDGYNAMIQP